MSLRTCWINGSYVSEADAHVSIFDRSVLFGDGVYEVAAVFNGRLLDADRHLVRLERSLRELAMPSPAPMQELETVMQELATRNGITEGLVYLQVTRGAAERDFAFPDHVQPTVFAFARPKKLSDDPHQHGMRVHVVPDIRWQRCDIKSTALLANVLANGTAQAAGVFETVLVADGWLREGSSTTVLLVKAGRLIAPPDSPRVLPGTTRDFLFTLAKAAGIAVERRDIRAEELHEADEVLLGFATRGALPVTQVDGRAVGRDLAAGRPGPVWQRLHSAFQARIKAWAETPFDAAPDGASSVMPQVATHVASHVTPDTAR